jgi:hypothetical protein
MKPIIIHFGKRHLQVHSIFFSHKFLKPILSSLLNKQTYIISYQIQGHYKEDSTNYSDCGWHTVPGTQITEFSSVQFLHCKFWCRQQNYKDSIQNMICAPHVMRFFLHYVRLKCEVSHYSAFNIYTILTNVGSNIFYWFRFTFGVHFLVYGSELIFVLKPRIRSSKSIII